MKLSSKIAPTLLTLSLITGCESSEGAENPAIAHLPPTPITAPSEIPNCTTKDPKLQELAHDVNTTIQEVEDQILNASKLTVNTSPNQVCKKPPCSFDTALTLNANNSTTSVISYKTGLLQANICASPPANNKLLFVTDSKIKDTCGQISYIVTSGNKCYEKTQPQHYKSIQVPCDKTPPTQYIGNTFPQKHETKSTVNAAAVKKLIQCTKRKLQLLITLGKSLKQ